MIVVASIGKGARTAHSGTCARVEVVAVCGASHRADPTTAGGSGSTSTRRRVVRRTVGRSAKQSCPRGSSVFGQGAVQMHGIVVTVAVGGGEGTWTGARVVVATTIAIT